MTRPSHNSGPARGTVQGEHPVVSLRHWQFQISWGLLYSVITLLAYVALYGPSNLVWDGGFPTSLGGITAGDHVQMTYYLWLWWHSLTSLSHLPWLDPFQFAATGHVMYQAFGWPLVLVSLPVQFLYGQITAFNAVFYAGFVAASGCMYLWVRKLGVSRAGAAVAGFAFAFAPFRLAQAFHANSILSFLLPLCLYLAESALRGPERWRRIASWLCAFSFISITASAEMHVVAYFTPVFAAYIVIRTWRLPREQLRSLVLPATTIIVGSLVFGFLTFWLTFRPSLRGAVGIGNNALLYAPRISDVIRKGSSERTAYPGIVITGLATLGAVAGLRRHGQRSVVTYLTVLIPVAYLLAVLPSVGQAGLRLYKSFPILSLIQVPGRILIISTLALAGLAAFGFERFGPSSRFARMTVAVILAVTILLDSHFATNGVHAEPADPQLMTAVPAGASVLELPPLSAGNYAGSRYQLQLTFNPGPRVGGYYVFVTPEADRAQRLAGPLTDVPLDPCRWLHVSAVLRFDYVAVHRSLFGRHRLLWHSDGGALVGALDATPGFERISSVKDVVVYRYDKSKLRCGQP